MTNPSGSSPSYFSRGFREEKIGVEVKDRFWRWRVGSGRGVGAGGRAGAVRRSTASEPGHCVPYTVRPCAYRLAPPSLSAGQGADLTPDWRAIAIVEADMHQLAGLAELTRGQTLQLLHAHFVHRLVVILRA